MATSHARRTDVKSPVCSRDDRQCPASGGTVKLWCLPRAVRDRIGSERSLFATSSWIAAGAFEPLRRSVVVVETKITFGYSSGLEGRVRQSADVTGSHRGPLTGACSRRRLNAIVKALRLKRMALGGAGEPWCRMVGESSMDPLNDVRQISRIAYGFIASKTLFAALNLDLFSRLSPHGKTLAELTSEMKIPRHRLRMLDVAGGSGAFTITLCRRHAQLRATILDFQRSSRSRNASCGRRVSRTVSTTLAGMLSRRIGPDRKT